MIHQTCKRLAVDPFYNDFTILLRLSVDLLIPASVGDSTLRVAWHRRFRGPCHTNRGSLRIALQCLTTENIKRE